MKQSIREKLKSKMNNPLKILALYGLSLVFSALLLLVPGPAMAVRPFVTDDARVVGKDLFLLETSLKRDKTRLQNLNLLAYGPTDNLELTLGFSDGFLLEGDNARKASIAGPLAQAKYLFTQGTTNGYPGVALVAGGGAPYGSSEFAAPSWSQFAYLALTEAFGDKERILIHVNVGISHAKPDDTWKYAMTWGVGTQIRLVGGLHYVGEIFHGDPYSGDTGGSFQTGFRYFVSDRIQIDATGGSGFWGDNKPETFFGCGIRFIFDPPW